MEWSEYGGVRKILSPFVLLRQNEVDDKGPKTHDRLLVFPCTKIKFNFSIIIHRIFVTFHSAEKGEETKRSSSTPWPPISNPSQSSVNYILSHDFLSNIYIWLILHALLPINTVFPFRNYWVLIRIQVLSLIEIWTSILNVESGFQANEGRVWLI